MGDTNLNAYKDYFIKMAKGEIPYSHFYVIDMKRNDNTPRVNIKLVAPTEEAVEQAKVEINLDDHNSIRGSKRAVEDDIYDRNVKRKPPGRKTLNRKPLWK
jgi:hypothetical protein